MTLNFLAKIRGIGNLHGRILLLSLFVGLAVASLSELGLFRVPNYLLFDLAVSQAEPTKPQVLLVRAEPSELESLFRYFRDDRPRAIIVTDFGSSVPNAPSNVYVGVLPAAVFGTDRWYLPASAGPGTSTVADVVPLNQGLVARSFYAWLPGRNSRLPTIEGKILDESETEAEWLINLNPKSAVAVVDGRQILDGQLPIDTLKNMYVVVGPTASIDPKRFLTSSFSDTPRISSSEFHARAIQAIVAGRTVFQPEGVRRALILIAASLILMVSLQMVPQKHQLASAVLTATVIFAAGLALIPTLGIYLPIAGLVTVSLVHGTLCEVIISTQRRRRTDELLDRATSQLQQAFPRDTSRWVDFFSTAAKLSGVETSLLLQEQDDGTFTALAAFGQLPAGGVSKLRRSRDFDLADASSPASVTVTNLVREENSFLVRFGTQDTVKIYWLYMLPAASDELAQIGAAAERLAGYISDNLRWFRYAKFGTINQRSVEQRVDKAINGLVRRTDELHRSLASLQTATLLFDPSGMPITVNESMKHLLGQSALQVSRTTPADCAIALTGLGEETVRSTLGQLVRHGGQVRLQSQLKIAGRNYFLVITNLDGDLLFEATDITGQTLLINLQSELASEIDAKLRNNLEAIGIAVRLAGDERLTKERRDRALGLIHVAVDRTRASLNSLSILTDFTHILDELSTLPVCPRATLSSAISKITPLAKQSDVGFNLVKPALASLVLAEPEMLEQLLVAIIQVVLKDSSRKSAIEIELLEKEDSTCITVKGGFGLPSSLIASHLQDDHPDATEPFLVMRRIVKRMKNWGATLEASSETGDGYRFTVALKRS